MLRPTWFSSLAPGDVLWRHLYTDEKKDLFVLDRAEIYKLYYDPYPLIRTRQGFLLEYIVLQKKREGIPSRFVYSKNEMIPVREINLTPSNSGDWFWTCTCMNELLVGIIHWIPKDVWNIVINYLYATNMDPQRVFADSTRKIWMPPFSFQKSTETLWTSKLAQPFCEQKGRATLLWTSKLPQLCCDEKMEIPWKQYLTIDNEERMDLCEVQLVLI